MQSVILREALPKIITESVPGPKSKELIERRREATAGAVACGYPVAIARGEGAMVEDLDGNHFLDWVGGVGVLNIGYTQPEIVEAVKEQADKYFHGRTVLTMSMTSKKAYAKDMGPLAPGVFRARFPYLYRKPEGMPEDKAIDYYVKSIQDVFEECGSADTIAAIVVEPLQGEGGFIPAPIEWVKAVRQICDDHGILLVADEVQSGFCRTGRMFASEYWLEAGCEPDILATAKSIAAGMPLSAVITQSEIMDVVPAGTIGGTFNGNALSCAAGLKTIEIMEREKLADRALAIGDKVMARYAAMKEKYSVIGDVRGLGAMIGLEFVTDQETREPNAALVKKLVQSCASQGLIVESAGIYGNVIRFLAPLVITDEQLEVGLDIMENSIAKLTK